MSDKITIYRHDDRELVEVEEYIKLQHKAEELKKYVNHTRKCQRYHQGGVFIECTCGLDKLLKKN